MMDSSRDHAQRRLSEAECSRLRRSRIEEFSSAPREPFADPENAEKVLLELRRLCGALPPESEGTPDWAALLGEVLDAVAQAYRGAETIEAAEAALMRVVHGQLNWPLAASADHGTESLPERRLWLQNHSGAVLSEGTVCLLAGEGGVAKTTLVLHLALETAASRGPSGGNGHTASSGGGCAGLGSAPGRVLFVSYEDDAAVCRWRLRRLARRLDSDAGNGARRSAKALKRVHLLDMAGHPLFGPQDGHSYNSRPVPLPGWWLLRRQALQLDPTLIVIDPALSAYVGDPIATAAVREFLSALSGLATETESGVLLLAHSTKAARRSADPFDPGHIGGSAAWHDGVRGAMVLAREDSGDRVLRVSKSNYGPAYVQAVLEPVVDPNTGAPVGFAAGGEWVGRSKSGVDALAANLGNGREAVGRV